MTGTNYVAISRRPLDLEDYIDIARRHVGWIIGPTFAGLVISVVVANLLPNTYVSRAIMQITPPTISESLVQSVSTQQLNDRVVQMQNEILSIGGLSSIITDPRLNLYANDLKKKPLQDVIEQMRQDVRIDFAAIPGSAGKRASAFTITFSYPDRFKARDTVQAFVSKFTEANLNSQRTTSVTVKSFFESELGQAKANLDQLDEQLARFRAQNTGKLPEEAQYNMSSMAALQQQLNATTESMNRYEQNRLQIEAALSTARLQLQTAESLSQDSDIGSPVAQRNEELNTVSKQVKDLDTRIAVLRQSFHDNYPDLRDLINTREVLVKKQAQLQKDQEAEENKAKTAPKTPARTNAQMATYLGDIRGKIQQYNAQLEGLRLQRTKDQEKLDRINQDITRIQRRLDETPGIDLTYKSLARQQEIAQQKYQEILKKQQLASQNDAMITAKAAENLEVLDAPTLPEVPNAPKRPYIIGAGAALSIVLGFALAAAREVKDSSLKNLKDVRAYTNLPVLSSIPLLENALLVRRKRRIVYVAWSAAVVVGFLMIGASLYYRYAVAA